MRERTNRRIRSAGDGVVVGAPGGARPKRIPLRLALALCVAAATVLVPPGASAARQPGGARLDLRLERTPVIVSHSYRRLPRIGKAGQMGASLDSGEFSLAHQGLGDLYVRAGIIRGKPGLIEKGFRGFDYAFRRQRGDGSLPASQTEEYAFFLEAVAHSVFLLRKTRYEDRFRGKLRGYVRRVRRAARHMITPAAWSDFRYRNRFYTHSGFTVGTALALAGELANRKRLTRHGRRAVALGLRRQRGNGVNPELGGYDVRYQMAGIAYAERYRVYFPGGRLKKRINGMVKRGLRWMSRRVDRDGWIDWRGSTRACRELNSNGELKSPGYENAIRGFAYWGALMNRDRRLGEARAMNRYSNFARNLCGPKEHEQPVAPPDERSEDSRPDGTLGRLLDPELAEDLYE